MFTWKKFFSSNNLIKVFIFFFCFLLLKKKYLNFCSNHLTGNISARIYYSWSCIDLHSQQDLFHRDHIYIQKTASDFSCSFSFVGHIKIGFKTKNKKDRRFYIYICQKAFFLSFFLLLPLISFLLYLGIT